MGPATTVLFIHSTVLLDCGIITIGKRVMFGPFVSIFAATHETEVQSRRDNVEYAREVTILPGVTIGQGCTVASNSVVTKDVPEWSVAMGVAGEGSEEGEAGAASGGGGGGGFVGLRPGGRGKGGRSLECLELVNLMQAKNCGSKE